MRDYYAHPPTLGERLRCFVLCLLTVGHDFEQYFTRIYRPYKPGNYTRLSPFGEVALVCRRCELVRDRRDYDGLLPEIYSGRGARREVHHLPIAPDGEEPLCGVSPPAGLGVPPGLSCQKFAWHNRCVGRCMRTHDASLRVRGGSQSYLWDDDHELWEAR